MSEEREPGFDRIVALVLRMGAFAGFVIMLIGVLDPSMRMSHDKGEPQRGTRVHRGRPKARRRAQKASVFFFVQLYGPGWQYRCPNS
jgi:hypothetical protein